MEEEDKRDVAETRDDIDQVPEEREQIEISRSNGSGDQGFEMAPKRKNKYSHIVNIQPEIFFNESESGDSYDGEESSYATGRSSRFTDDVYASEMEPMTSLEGTDDEDSDSEAEENLGAFTEAEADDPSFSEFFDADNDDEKIEYTIFELESMLSSNPSSHVSTSSSGSSDSGDHEEDDDSHSDDTYIEGHDTDVADQETDIEGQSDYEVKLRASKEEMQDTADEDSINEGDHTASLSEAESDSEDESDDESVDKDDGGGLMFVSLCRRPETSFDDLESIEEENQGYRRNRRKHRKSSRSRGRGQREPPRVTSLFRCVSNYLVGEDLDDYIVEDTQALTPNYLDRRHRKRRF